MIRSQQKWHRIMWLVLPFLLLGTVILLAVAPGEPVNNQSLPFLDKAHQQEAHLP